MEFPSTINSLYFFLRLFFREVIEIFLKLCSECELKKGTPKKGVVLKPITSDDRNSRCQVDLIDIQACPDGDYKFILVYQVFPFFLIQKYDLRKNRGCLYGLIFV